MEEPLLHFALFVLAGFLAQMIDGMLSMGYGASPNDSSSVVAETP